MSEATIVRELSRLEEIGRVRALSEYESCQLQRMVAVQQRQSNDRGRYAERKRQGVTRKRHPIVDRLNATIERMAREKLTIRAIYLVERDLQEIKAANALVAGGEEPTYAGHPVRATAGARRDSVIYSIHGIGRAVRSKGA